MACEQERLWELQYLQYKTEIVAIKKSKKCNKKREIFSFLKNLSVLFVKLLPFREQKNSQAQAETYGISGRRRAPEGLSGLLRQRP